MCAFLQSLARRSGRIRPFTEETKKDRVLRNRVNTHVTAFLIYFLFSTLSHFREQMDSKITRLANAFFLRKLPSGQVDKVHLGNSLRRHVAFREAGLYEGYRKNRMTPATHVVHLCASCRSVRITSHHAFLEQK